MSKNQVEIKEIKIILQENYKIFKFGYKYYSAL